MDICGGPPRGPCFVEVAEEIFLGEEDSVILGREVHYPEEKLLTQLFSIESNLSIYAL